MRTGAWMPMYWGDYLRDTMHLTLEQHGAYILLIASYWSTGRPLPGDDDSLARILGLSRKKWKMVRQKVEPFFEVSDGVWRHKRLEKEILSSNDRLTSARTAGQASAERRRQLTTPTPIESELTGNTESYIEGLNPITEHCQNSSQDAPLSATPTMVLDGDCQSIDDRGFDAWNIIASKNGLAKCQARTKKRRSAIIARIRDAGGIDAFELIVCAIPNFPYLLGDSDQGWRANIDWLLRPQMFAKLAEGGYQTGKKSKVDQAGAWLKEQSS